MIDPTEADIGRKVIYRRDSLLPGETEYGLISSFNDHYVFVRYGGSPQAQATLREDLNYDC